MREDTTTTESVTRDPDATTRKRAIRGFGYCYRRGRIWWLRYSHRGRDHRESSHSERESDAWRLLKERWKQIGRGRFVFGEDRATMEDLFAGLELDYRNNSRRSLGTLRWRLAPLRAVFDDDRAVDVTEARIERYKADRLASPIRGGTGEDGSPVRTVAPATVNRELTILKRAFRLAVRQKRISVAPTIELLEEAAPRQGFLEPAAFERVASRLPDDLGDLARFAYVSGWRKGEVRRLAWPDVDRAAGRIVLRREHSKNGEPRVLPLVGDLAALVERRWRAREYETPEGGTALASLVFHRAGRPLGDFRRAWASACQAAGVAGTLFHDLRRSAVRNMDRAGVSQTVAMALSGHKTASVYRRYRIVDESDLRAALARTQASLGSHPGTVTPLRAGTDGVAG
jgi:integrase